MSTIEKIYDIIPKYHAIWKNDYSGWSFGEVGGDARQGIVASNAEFIGDSLEEILNYCLNKYPCQT